METPNPSAIKKLHEERVKAEAARNQRIESLADHILETYEKHEAAEKKAAPKKPFVPKPHLTQRIEGLGDLRRQMSKDRHPAGKKRRGGKNGSTTVG